ncbi:endo alpha-1,4 polygalactosaminidase [Kribbella sp. CA-293567]|uniref:endo alpha-1,4 polygalactosaminidase n=1 Tax=Kribbella sp. CA-293567 TaxID=3002436 RepID=UPI0022DD3BF9|nr:endo alpha-1,4 polygalactosaminidase [Kribbella sp. CA-293567]WBQ03526.1 endo alpha-1,4 polygalactosaminidase [Kribbella sp. CA-293567]
MTLRVRHLLVGLAVSASLIACADRSAGGDNPATPPTPVPAVAPAELELPPLHAGFDYQLGGPYPPAAGVRIVIRDRTAPAVKGLYNICYVNAFQTQPDEDGQWDQDLLLRDNAGNLVIDEDWDEPLLDLRTAGKRERIAAKVNTWIDGCADNGYQAIEPDNYDSYTRSKNLLTADQAKQYLSLLAKHAHSRRLAIGQKNTAELVGDRATVGLDFAVSEECGQYDECATYADAFGNNVLVIEYTAEGLRKACRTFGTRLSIVRRDLDVTTPDNRAYVRRTC